MEVASHIHGGSTSPQQSISSLFTVFLLLWQLPTLWACRCNGAGHFCEGVPVLLHLLGVQLGFVVDGWPPLAAYPFLIHLYTVRSSDVSTPVMAVTQLLSHRQWW